MLVKVLRPYSGQEGKRVRVGTELFVNVEGSEAPEGAIVISVQRYKDLSRVGLVETGMVDTEKPAKRTGKNVAPPKPKVTDKVANARKQQAPNTTKKGKDPTSIRIGKVNAPSSSVVVPASEAVTSKPRGKRGERAGSESTTPTVSSETQTPSTPQTPPGGDSTEPPLNPTQDPPFV